MDKTYRIAKRNIDDAVVGKSTHRSHGGTLLSTAHGRRRDEDTGILVVVAALLPLSAGLVPEGLPLRREVAVSGWDAQQESVILFESGRVRERLDVGWLGRSLEELSVLSCNRVPALEYSHQQLTCIFVRTS